MARFIPIALIILIGSATHVPLWAASHEKTAVAVEPKTVEGGGDVVSLSGVDQRLRHIERVLENQVMLEMLQHIESLQGEIRELRGEIENQGFELQLIRKRQRNLYLDTDRRLRDLELTGRASTKRSDEVDVGNSGTNSVAGATAIDSSGGASGGSTVGASPPSTDPAQEKAAYTKAFNYLKEGRYEGAIKVFGQFLQDFPDGDYTDNAQYWLGEANYVSRFFDVAIEEFSTVVNKYPASPKLPDARLKIGYAYYELENWEAARDTLSALEQDFPGTSVAQLATKRLARMRTEGH